MKKYEKRDQRALARWAADCAERVLPLFEKAAPQDARPRKAIEACREWVQTDVFRMDVIRGVSLAAHAAARDMQADPAACFAARAAGHAVATAHVAQHAFRAALYALKASVAADHAQAQANAAAEQSWQARQVT